MGLIAKKRAAALAAREESESFVDLVTEYADMGYSRYAVAKRLLNIDPSTMDRWLSAHGAVVDFKSPGDDGYQPWDDAFETRAAIRDARVRNGTVRMLSCGGEILHLAEWSRRTGIKTTTIARRIDRYGWPVEKALTTPARAEMGPKNPSRKAVSPRARAFFERGAHTW